LVYSVFQYNGPLVYEEHQNRHFEQKKEIILSEKAIIFQTFRANMNNLGIININLVNKKRAIDQQSINLEKEETAKVTFRIREENSEEYFYQNDYSFNSTFETSFYPFGFPIQKESLGKKYVVELLGNQVFVNTNRDKEKSDQSGFLAIQVNKNNQINFYSRYVYSPQDFIDNPMEIINNLGKKTLQVFYYQGASKVLVLHLLLSAIFSLSLLIINKSQLIKSFFAFSLFINSLVGPLSLYQNINIPDTVKYYLLIITLIFGAYYLIINKNTDAHEKGKYWVGGKILFIFSIIIFLCFTFPLLNKEIRGDEWHQFNLAHGLLKTGEFNEWNFIYDRPEFEYNRGHPATIVISLFFAIFGTNEVTARAPGLIMALLFLFLLYYLVNNILKEKILSSLIVFYFASNPVFIQTASYLRGYIYIMPITLLFFIKILNFVDSDKNIKNIRLFSFSVFLLWIAYKIHLIGATLAIPLALALFLKIIKFFKSSNRLSKFVLGFGSIGLLYPLFLSIYPIYIKQKGFTKEELIFSSHSSVLSLLNMDIYFVIMALLFFLFILLFRSSRKNKKTNKKIIFLIVSTLGIHLFYDLFAYSNKGTVPRYMIQLLILNPLLFYLALFWIFKNIGIKKNFIALLLLINIAAVNFSLFTNNRINTNWSSEYNYIDMYGGVDAATSIGRQEVYHEIAYPKIIEKVNQIPQDKKIIILSDMVIENYYFQNLNNRSNDIALTTMRCLSYGFQNITRGKIISDSDAKCQEVGSIEDILQYQKTFDYGFIFWPYRKYYKVNQDIRGKINNNSSFEKISGRGVDDSYIETYYWNNSDN